MILSIITITYNAGRFLERTIQSIGPGGAADPLARLGPGFDFEYLIIDGASTDNTLDIVRQYEAWITHWQSEPDRGLYDAMNKGLHRAKGDYVWFMNAGDELHDPQTLPRLLDTLRTGTADIYYSDALFVRDNGSPVGLRSRITPHTLLPLGKPTNQSGSLSWVDMALGMKICHQAFVVRRGLAPDYLTDNLSADLDWEIRCLKAARRVELLPFVLCRYLIGGLSVQQHRRSLTDRFRVLVRHFGLLPTLWHHVRIAIRAGQRAGVTDL
jgi:glycosyltransferase involved in cell wall biosynthesis